MSHHIQISFLDLKFMLTIDDVTLGQSRPPRPDDLMMVSYQFAEHLEGTMAKTSKAKKTTTFYELRLSSYAKCFFNYSSLVCVTESICPCEEPRVVFNEHFYWVSIKSTRCIQKLMFACTTTSVVFSAIKKFRWKKCNLLWNLLFVVVLANNTQVNSIKFNCLY